MIKVIFAQMVVFVIIASGVLYILDSANKRYEEISARNQEKLGEPYVIGKDTLKIVDYSIWESTFTLSNGVKIRQELIINDTIQ
tara:strand:+ start:318 stop:569 length:252 start_codon:yes stop_codon:yes gene_type:complete